MNRAVLAFALALAAAVPFGRVDAATNIACVDDGYSAEEIAALERFYLAFQPAQLRGQSVPLDIFAAVSRRAGECADLHNWPAAAIEDASFYRMASILKVALDRKNPFTAPQLRRLEEAISSVDQARLNSIFGGLLDASLEGNSRRPSDADAMFLGRLFLRAGIPATQSNAEYVGAFLGARLMIEQSRQRFAAR